MHPRVLVREYLAPDNDLALKTIIEELFPNDRSPYPH
jgi:hypothetical protein